MSDTTLKEQNLQDEINSPDNTKLLSEQHKLAKKISYIAKEIFKPFGLEAGCHLLESQSTGDIKCINVILRIETIEVVVFRALTVVEMYKKITYLHEHLSDLIAHSTEVYTKDILQHLLEKSKKIPELAVILFELEVSLNKLQQLLTQNLHKPIVHSELKH